jgi:tripartite-type tricarboxylate transporter receptor subunit TctC
MENENTPTPQPRAPRVRKVVVAAETPTVAEAGFPDAYLDVWSGLFLPAGVPPGVANRLMEATTTVLASDAAAAWAARTDSRRMLDLAGPAFGAFVAAELVRWKGIVDFAGARVE